MTNGVKKILCLCYTNHALDSFLEDLIGIGIPKNRIVRLGRSHKISEALQDCCLGNMSATNFDRHQNYRYAMLKKSLDELKFAVDSVSESIRANAEWGIHSWREVQGYLTGGADELYFIYQELEVTDAGKLANDAYTQVGHKGQKLYPDSLWRMWLKGAKQPEWAKVSVLANGQEAAGEGSGAETTSIWSLTLRERLARVAEWRLDYLKPLVNSLALVMGEYARELRKLTALRNEAHLSTLSNAIVIGCTTTMAAKSKELLSDVGPSVVIVEEAAEILEAHVLTTLSPSVQSLIMIGDHMQLRPKLQNYELRYESGKGVDFDVSLFERLCKQQEPEFPIVTLNVQHRMRPEISSMVRFTYPSLEDHSTVCNRDPILGVSSDFVWVDHRSEETSDEDKIGLGTSSKTNRHEVVMAVEMVRYFLQQGYSPSEIVILTPYLGQLLELQSALRSAALAVTLSDLDIDDLKKARVEVEPNDEVAVAGGSNSGVGTGNKGKTKGAKDHDSKSAKEDSRRSADSDSRKVSVRVATVDNYQGEESRIVIASLVRSNVERDIGFCPGLSE